MSQDISNSNSRCSYCCAKECCFPNLSLYAENALVTNTTQVFGTTPASEKNDPCCDICLCLTCFPLRFVMTLPWCFGASINSCISICTKKEKNYLC
jgi:hypothetical protein